jgi:hypothetical protein
MYSHSARRAAMRLFQSAIAITFAFAGPADAQHVVSGTVRTADGRPLAGATIRVSGATGAARGTTLKTQSDRNGNYRIEVRPGDYDVDAFYDLAFDGQTYRELWLDRANEGCGRQLSERGIVRHFVLRLSGLMRCRTDFDPNKTGSYAGATVLIDPGNLPASAAVRFTFTPLGVLADGTKGKALTFDRTGAMLGRAGGRLGETAWLHDIPLGRYRVSAEARLGGTTRALLLQDNSGGTAGAAIEIGFPAVRMYPYGIRSASITIVDRATQPLPPAPETNSDPVDADGMPRPSGGGLPVGRYECSHRSEYAGDIPNGRTVVILDGGRYQAWGSSGSYAGSPGAVQWTSGPFAQRGVSVTFAQDGSRAVLTVKGGAAASDPGGANRCVRYGS